jgi:hypothetical protein
MFVPGIPRVIPEWILQHWPRVGAIPEYALPVSLLPGSGSADRKCAQNTVDAMNQLP